MTQPATRPLFAQEQFRMFRLQVFNWGTFSGIHDILIAQKGFLFVGRSGAGKTTLLDAFSALLVPPRWVDFNAAAREMERNGRDRNIVSYLRGAWAEQKDSDSGEIATRYLRPGTTWSALALSYKNNLGHTVVLVQIFWLRGNATGNSDVKRHYLIFERNFDLQELEHFGQSNLDVRKLKLSFPEVFARDEFRPYCERFCRLLGIESEMALRLLHKTQSAKNLGELNTFLREFMLDKPETFEVADRLVSEFSELNAAHLAVVTAREQLQILKPAREQYQQMQSLILQRNGLQELQEGIDNYRDTRRIELLKQHLDQLRIGIEGLAGEAEQRHSSLNNYTIALRDLERQHREMGGDQIVQWQEEKQMLESQCTNRLRKRGQAEEACRNLDINLPNSPQEFAQLVGNARVEIEHLQEKSDSNREKQLKFATQKKEAEMAFSETVKEVQVLQRQPSNIPADFLELRQRIATEIGISETALPFVGELIEVKPDATAWQGAIERVLHGFALSLLVDERHYPALSQHINHTHLAQRLVYYRTGQIENGQAKPISSDSLFLKLNVKEGHYSDWLKTELQQRFDYTCVASMQSFKSAQRALTQEGQIKHSKTRHEKDDRRNINDRRHWVLGFDNREKLALFQKQAQELAASISSFDEEIKILSQQDRNRSNRAMHCQTLANLQWQEIDVTPLIERIATIDLQILQTRKGNNSFQQIFEQINRQQEIINQAEEALRETKVEQKNIRKEIDDKQEKLQALQNNPSIIPLTPHQQQGLDERYAKMSDKIYLDNLDRLTTTVLQSLNKEMETLHRGLAQCEKHIENQFIQFKQRWPIDASDLDTSLASATDFFAKLTRLEKDGLPAHEQRFFELLQNQSHQNLASLSSYLNDARKAILERMELVNESLSQVPFNQNNHQKTYLHIDVSDRQLPEVREFKQQIQQALSHAWSDDREFAESRFLVLRELVKRLSSLDPEEKRWRSSVLDVRLHVEFIGREIDASGVEVEIYRSGAGKSGGQRQKLTTTCLAAALRYQLGGNDYGTPIYAPVILDEAFDKADNEFTALAMNIFANFGFQMIIATPLKSVMTLEPFIGGACFVDIHDRCISSVLLIEYDDTAQRLQLPEQTHKETSLETA